MGALLALLQQKMAFSLTADVDGGSPVLANVVRSKTAALSGHAEVEGAVTHYGTTTPKLAPTAIVLQSTTVEPDFTP